MKVYIFIQILIFRETTIEHKKSNDSGIETVEKEEEKEKVEDQNCQKPFTPTETASTTPILCSSPKNTTRGTFVITKSSSLSDMKSLPVNEEQIVVPEKQVSLSLILIFISKLQITLIKLINYNSLNNSYIKYTFYRNCMGSSEYVSDTIQSDNIIHVSNCVTICKHVSDSCFVCVPESSVFKYGFLISSYKFDFLLLSLWNQSCDISLISFYNSTVIFVYNG